MDSFAFTFGVHFRSCIHSEDLISHVWDEFAF